MENFQSQILAEFFHAFHLSKYNLDLVESISLISYIQRQDYWDYEHMPLSYAIFDKTIDNILENVENHIDDENMEFLEIFIKK